MKNGRTICIKDPKLQKIRNNLRLIILEESSRRKSEIRDQEYAINHDKDGNYVRSSEEDIKGLQELTNKWWEIERPLRASIVKCATCGKSNKNMTYHRKDRTWDCVDCHRKNFG